MYIGQTLCDKCGKASHSNQDNSSNYKLYTDERSDSMHECKDSKKLELCPKCASELISILNEFDRSEQIKDNLLKALELEVKEWFYGY